MVAEQVEAKRLVFVDEMGTNTSLSALYAWAPKGERARWSVPRNRGANTTVLSSMALEGMGSALTVEGATTSAVFETYVEQVLAPTVRKGQVVVMDNPSAHKGERVKQLIEGRGCELIYLPSYSPEFDPIEEAFAKIKGFLRACLVRVRVSTVLYAIPYEKDISNRPLRCPVDPFATVSAYPKSRGKTPHPLLARLSRRHLLRGKKWLSLAAFAPRLSSVVYRLLPFQKIPIERVVVLHPQRAACGREE
jgi:hypothetical protein